jgi:cellulose synthase (UDP-forming)
LKQHQRWTRGGVQVFVRDNPLFKPGLTLMQRLHYLGSLLYFFHGWTRIAYLLAPLPFLYFGRSTIVAPAALLLNFFLPYYVANQAAFLLLTRRFRSPFWSDVYETAGCFALACTAVATLLHPGKILFAVTPKEVDIVGERTRWAHLVPHIAAFVLLAGGLAVAVMRMARDGITAGAGSINMIWTVYNLLLLGVAIAAGRERPRVRQRYRLHRRLRCRFSFDGKLSRGWTHDLSERGQSAYMRSPGYLSDRGTVLLRCRCGQDVRLKAHVVWQKAWGREGRLAGFRFDDVDDSHRRQLTRLLFGCSHSWAGVRFPIHGIRASFGQMMTSFEHASEHADPQRERTEGLWKR